MYSVFRLGGSLVKPLFFDYPNDPETFNNNDITFMLGDALKISPVLAEGMSPGDNFTSYFPAGMWYNLSSEFDHFAFNSTGEYINLYDSI